MMDQAAPMRRPSLMKGLLQRIQHEVGVRCSADAPAHDAPGVGVDHEGHINESGPGADVGEVGEPEHVRRWRVELPVHMI